MVILFILSRVNFKELENQKISDSKSNLQFSKERKHVMFPVLVKLDQVKKEANKLNKKQNDVQDVGSHEA